MGNETYNRCWLFSWPEKRTTGWDEKGRYGLVLHALHHLSLITAAAIGICVMA
jgi:hypothetical protein